MLPIEQEISIKVFISYAHADQELREKLEEHLSSLKYSGEITIWQDQEIPAGTNWEDQINTHLNEADLILLLISASFIASKYCWSKEMQTALQRHKDGLVRIIPIIIKPALWQNTPLGPLQVLPTGAKPVTQWNDYDSALDDVARGIQNVVHKLLEKLLLKTLEESKSELRQKAMQSDVYRQKILEKLKYLEERAYEIGEVVEVVSDIAHQTNRLALDAAVQAAVAGENGKGFRIVAADIRSLAEQCVESTKHLATLIKNTQNGTHEVLTIIKDLVY